MWHAFVFAGNRILAATERLQLWAPPLTDALIEEEDGQLTEDRPHPVLNDWNCVWQCKYVPLPSSTCTEGNYM